MLTGMEWDGVLEAVGGSLNEADEDVCNSILNHVAEAARTPRQHPMKGGPLHDDDGNLVHETHFFVYWLMGLREGSWSLPVLIPRACWRDSTAGMAASCGGARTA